MYVNLTSTIKTKSIILFVIGVGFIVFFDVFLSLLIALPHSFLMLLHYMFEFCEHTLDMLIEHLFHTDPHTTEIIVFYIMALIIGCILIKLIMVLPDLCCKTYGWLSNYCENKKAKVLNEWRNQPPIEKIKWGSVFMTSTIVMFVLTMT
jgi:hypothetical protein